MINGRRITAVVLGALVVTTAGYADMVPMSSADVGRGVSLPVPAPSIDPSTGSPGLFGTLSTADLHLSSIRFLPEADADAAQTSATQSPPTVTNGPDSLALCFSALLGLGLCSSVHRVKRLSLGFIPDWYHDGGPFQVGHSHALMPSCLYSVLAVCSVQPVCAADNPAVRYRQGAVLFPVRKPQWAPAAGASRGPPLS
jgi:hypothetical protein